MPQGYDLRILPEVDSTMSEAARQAASTSGPLWLLAHQQTQARGRRGRTWVNPRGNFAATLILRPSEPPDQVALRSFVMALALFDALATVTGRAEALALKWPNDVLLNGGKVAGILLENSPPHLFIGVGINLIAAPAPDQVEPQAVRPVDLLSVTGAQVTPEEMLGALAQAYATREHSFVTYGFAPIRDAWLSRAARLGEVITARTTQQETTGTFETVDAQGQLVLKTSKSRVCFPAADVFF